MPATADRLQGAVARYQRGELDEAERLCRELVAQDAGHFDAFHLLGLVTLAKGDGPRALSLLQRSLELNPAQAVVLLNTGSLQLELGDPQRALESFEAALALRPDLPDALGNRASALARLGRPAEALSSIDKAIGVSADRALFHAIRGAVLRDLKRPQDALASYERALTLAPDQVQAHIDYAATLTQVGRAADAHAALDAAIRRLPNTRALLVSRGNLKFQSDRLADALADYEQALALAPGDADVEFNRALALYRLGRFDAALTAFDSVAAARPMLPKAHFYRAEALRALGRIEQALASYGRAATLDQRYADALCGAGNALRDLGRLEEALAAYDAALRVDGASPEALSNRGRVLLALGRAPEAAAALDQLLETAGPRAAEFNYALGNLLHARLSCCDWRDFEPLRDRIVAAVLDDRPVTLPSLLLAMSDSSDAQLRCARRFVANNWSAVNLSATAPADPHDKIRLAYVSADFREHPVAMLLAGLIESHDRQRFEIIAISLRPPDASALGRRMTQAFDRFVDASRLDDAQTSEMMRALGIDVAIDLNGYTEGFRPGIFARRAAPVQVSYLGYAGTSGAPYIDYLIADEVVVPESERNRYSERIVYLPDCYLPTDSKRAIAEEVPSRERAGLPEKGFVFCCFNNAHKILPPVFDVWMRLVAAVPDSVLWLAWRSPEAAQNLRREAARRGVNGERLAFAPRVGALAEHLARYRLADLFLDTLPFNAHSTAIDALSVGLPVLTCRGSTFAGRVAASLLGAAGLPELITEDLTGYEAAALDFARTPERLRELRARCEQARRTTPLFDAERHRRHLEAAYLEMVTRQRQGRAPESFRASI